MRNGISHPNHLARHIELRALARLEKIAFDQTLPFANKRSVVYQHALLGIDLQGSSNLMGTSVLNLERIILFNFE